MNLRNRPGVTLQFLGLLLTVGLAAPAALAATSTPTTLTGTYSSTIVDWPTGKTGTVNLVGYDPNGVASGTIDTNGRFTIKLPDQNTMDLHLFAVSELFTPTSNFKLPQTTCVGQGTAVPASAQYNYFALLASVEGGEPINQLGHPPARPRRSHVWRAVLL